MSAPRRLAILAGVALCMAAPSSAAAQAYKIPADNPFVNTPGAAPEVFAYGFRNPYRFSFDKSTGDILIGDVGSGGPSASEEVNWRSLSAARGANFGWPCREGLVDNPTNDCVAAGALDPYFRYPTAGSSVIAGYVIRDPAMPDLSGRFLYADFFDAQIRSLALGSGGPGDAETPVTLTGELGSFGQDAAGRLYVTDHTEGRVFRLRDPPGSDPLATDSIGGTYAKPTHVASPPAKSSSLFVTEQQGRVLLIENGVAVKEPFLDIRNLVNALEYERGLLSIAFAPDYATSGRFFVFYTGADGSLTIDEFRRSADPRKADAGSRRPLLSIPHPMGNHNGGQLQFGPDGYLYVSTGDGGGQGDPYRNAQNLGSLLGKILRIDPTASLSRPVLPTKTVVADTLRPRLITRVPRRQRVLRLRGAVAYVRCSEACAIRADGYLRIGKRRYRMGRAGRAAQSVNRRRIKVPLTAKSRRALRKALRRGRSPTVRVGLRGVDAAGNPSVLVRRTVRVRR